MWFAQEDKLSSLLILFKTAEILTTNSLRQLNIYATVKIDWLEQLIHNHSGCTISKVIDYYQ